LTEQATEEQGQTLSQLRGAETTVRRISVVGVAGLLLGMPLVAGAYLLTRHYEHKETVREIEIERLAQAALTDGLTGLANHRAFQEDLRHEVPRASRNSQPITVAMIDVDDFKVVN